MSVRILAFTARGAGLARRLADALPDARLFCLPKFSEAGGEPTASMAEWVRAGWQPGEGLLFVGAVGIAVRAVAPFVESKATDPAVVVVDEGGRFAISLLSGHLGGANELARRAALACGAQPVVTTATDGRGAFAVDLFAARNRLAITSLREAKEISAAVLAGEKIGFFSALPADGALPPELTADAPQRKNIEIGLRRTREDSLLLIPRCLSLGLGCRRGTEADAIETAVQRALAAAELPREALFGAASVDLKRDEPGLRAWAQRAGLPLRFFSAAALAAVPGEFTASEFVKKTAGVDNVCERAAVLLSGGGRLILKKQAADGVTAALAVSEMRIRL